MRGAEGSEPFANVLAGRYEVGALLGAGGMATVFRARDRKHDRQVAVKVLRPELAQSIGVDRFLREIRVAAQLQHPHIVSLFDSGEIDGMPFYVMPLIEGESLRQRLERERQLPIEEAVLIVREIAGALQYAHEHGVIHRDVKPENVLMQDGHALIADFGLARAMSLSGAERLTQSGLTVGTPHYMSPEQSLSESADARSDIYSLGCVFYELLVGDPPFVGSDARSIIARHSAGTVPSLRVVRPSIPEELERVVMRALEKTPADRFQSAAALSQALDQAVSSGLSGPTASQAAPTETLDEGQSRRSRIRFVVAASAIVLTGLGAAFGLNRLRSAHDRPSSIGGDGGEAAVDVLQPRTIAVLDFDPASNGDSLSVFAGAITETLIERLRGVDSLRVVSRAGAQQFRGHRVAFDSIARALSAGTLVAGELTASGQTLHLDLRLIDGRTGATTVSTSVDGSTEHAFGLLDSSAAALSRLLQRQLGEAVQLRQLPVGTQQVRAWEAYQRARQTLAGVNEVLATGDIQRAVSRLSVADSAFANVESMDKKWVAPIVQRGFIAHRKLLLLANANSTRVKEWLDAASGHAQRAIALAPNDADALELLGTVRIFYWLFNVIPDATTKDKLADDAEADFRAAVRVNPFQVTSWAGLSYVLSLRNKSRESAVAARTAYFLDPYSLSSDKDLSRAFQAAFAAGDAFEAKRWCALGIRRFPHVARLAECRLMLFAFKGEKPRVDDLWATYQSLLNNNPPKPLTPFFAARWEMLVALGLIRAGLPDSARRVTIRARARDVSDPALQLNYYEAVVRSWLGEKDEAFRLLREYSRASPKNHVEDDDSWWLEELRLDARWKDLKQ